MKLEKESRFSLLISVLKWATEDDKTSKIDFMRLKELTVDLADGLKEKFDAKLKIVNDLYETEIVNNLKSVMSDESELTFEKLQETVKKLSAIIKTKALIEKEHQVIFSGIEPKL